MKQLTMIQLKAELAKRFEVQVCDLKAGPQETSPTDSYLLRQAYQCLENAYSHENLIDIREVGEDYESIIRETKALYFADKSHSLVYVLMTLKQLDSIQMFDVRCSYVDGNYDRFYGLEVLIKDKRKEA